MVRSKFILLYLVLGFILLGAGCAQLSELRGVQNSPLTAPTAQPDTAQPPVSGELDKVDVQSNVALKQIPAPAPAPHSITVLAVPFTPQAPHANWAMPYQEACEEASLVMLVEYLQGNNRLRIPAEEADSLIIKLIEWETDRGYAADLTAAEVVEVLAGRYGVAAKVVPYDAELIRRELTAKRPVILPAAGRLLGNPYFTRPGPLYHMLVVKGFAGNEFIVNDPGTKRGENYRYYEDVLARAVHDWNEGDVEHGARVMVILSE